MGEAHLAAALQGLGIGALIGWQVGYFGPEWSVYPTVFVGFAASIGGYALIVARRQDGGRDE